VRRHGIPHGFNPAHRLDPGHAKGRGSGKGGSATFAIMNLLTKRYGTSVIRLAAGGAKFGCAVR
jgi:hypothetical protein